MTSWDLPAPVHGLGAALAVGLLIGLERGWHQRDLNEGARVAGLRTFALTGLLGGVLGSLVPTFGPWPLVAGLAGLALLMAVAYLRSAQATGGLSATTSVALLLTLALGAYASSGAIALALAAAVVATVLLNLKPTLHGWLRQIEHRELTAALQLLVLSVVILPYLPNAGFGPYAALNPYALWWAVILIAGLSLAGHFAVRVAGPDRGLLWTGMLGAWLLRPPPRWPWRGGRASNPPWPMRRPRAHWRPAPRCSCAWPCCWASFTPHCCAPSAQPSCSRAWPWRA